MKKLVFALVHSAILFGIFYAVGQLFIRLIVPISEPFKDAVMQNAWVYPGITMPAALAVVLVLYAVWNAVSRSKGPALRERMLLKRLSLRSVLLSASVGVACALLYIGLTKLSFVGGRFPEM